MFRISFLVYAGVDSEELVITSFLSSETRGNPNSIGVKEEIIADRNSFTSGFSRTREGHVHHTRGLVLPSAVRPREKHGRAETVS